MRSTAIIAVLTLATGSLAARADFFSFASDSDPNGPTFAAPAYLPPGLGGFSDGGPLSADQIVLVDVLWDADEHGPGAPVVLPAAFIFNAVFRTYQVTAVSGGFLHSYTANGSFAFLVPGTGQTILQVTYQNAVFNTVSESQSLWGTTASFQSNDALDQTILFAPDGPLAGRDLTHGEGFSFSLSSLESTVGGRLPVDASGTVFPEWRAEGSWSAHAVPSPGVFAVAGAGWMVFRRSRVRM